MMSDTYQKIKEDSDVEWKFARVSNILEAIERTHPVPPPFSAPLLLSRFIWWVGYSGLNKGLSEEEQEEAEDVEWKRDGKLLKLKRKREKIARFTLQNMRKQQDEEEETCPDGRLKRIETLVEEVLVFSEDHERAIKFLEEKVKEEKEKGPAAARPRSSSVHA